MLPELSVLMQGVGITAHGTLRSFRNHVSPGAVVCFDPRSPQWDYADMALVMPHPHVQLEREAFTGRAEGSVTGCMGKEDVALAVAVSDDYAFVFAPRGYGWIDRAFVFIPA